MEILHKGQKRRDALVVILGPTASGKSALAVKLARWLALSRVEGFNGAEIVSADSRQVYRGLNIGSGKITKRQMQGIPHHLLDVASVRRRFYVAQYQTLALRAISQIQRRGRIPFLVGGTGLYIQSVVDGVVFPHVPPSPSIRSGLEKKSVNQLFAMLKKLDPARAATIDSQNPRRLIRAIEIVQVTGKPVGSFRVDPRKIPHQSAIVQIGIKKSPQELKKLIAPRLQKRIKKIITEVKKLHKNGLSWKRLEELGLEYRFVAQYLRGRLSLPQTISKIQIESEHFAKRQMTWFKRDQRIHWISNEKQAKKLIQKFLQ